MKYLSEYVEEKQTQAFKRANAFFAFSPSQFEEGKAEQPKGIQFVSLGGGLIADKTKADQLVKDLTRINKEGIAEDIKDNGIDNIIERELSNHEAGYTGEIDSTVDALEEYPTTAEHIMKVFRERRAVIC